jgi:sialate O-acetylesterase
MFVRLKIMSLLPVLVAGMLLVMTLMPGAGAQAVEQPSKPFLHPLFTDNMVLQRGVKDTIWGWTTPGRRVTVRMEGKSAHAIAAADGRWLLKIGPFKVGGPYTMTVTGPQSVTVKNVLVGDVWLCTGQSNMYMGVSQAQNGADEVAHADYPMIHFIRVPHTIAVAPRQTIESQWKVCTPENVKAIDSSIYNPEGWGGFSATAYFFGRELYQQTHIPIGLLETEWGGVVAQAWVSAGSLATMPDFQAQVAAMTDFARDKTTFDKSLADWWQQHDAGLANNNGWSAPDFDDAAWKTMPVPC